MKTYYAEGIVTYVDDNSEVGEEPYNGKEVYTVIVTANTRELGRNKALKEVQNSFEDDVYEEGITKNIIVELETFYETSEDARK